jgi:hypothetical protein
LAGTCVARARGVLFRCAIRRPGWPVQAGAAGHPFLNSLVVTALRIPSIPALRVKPHVGADFRSTLPTDWLFGAAVSDPFLNNRYQTWSVSEETKRTKTCICPDVFTVTGRKPTSGTLPALRSQRCVTRNAAP